MAVMDASVYVDALVGIGPQGADARAELRNRRILQVPAIFRAEAVSALRGLVLGGNLNQARAATAIRRVRSVRLAQYPFEPFVDRVWELRSNLTVYDAWYVALAERLGTDFVTGDDRVAKAPRLRCRVRRPGGG